MTDEEILEQAIRKALANGWEQDLVYIHGNTKDRTKAFLGAIDICYDSILLSYSDQISHVDIIYRHDFAKALWNTPMHSTTEVNFYTANGLSEWQHHLQQMVISDDPIAYLGANL